MQNITNIVYLMLENRSLDNVLGWLYSNSNPQNIIPHPSPANFDGLQTGPYYNPDNNGNMYPVIAVTGSSLTVPSVDPNEPYENVLTQLFYPQTNVQPGDVPGMQGFLVDFESTDSTNPPEILQGFTPEQLPVINGLAMQFAVSDAYFASMPTQTNCNRAFAATGNSIGTYQGVSTAMVDNHWYDEYLPVEFSGRTIWDVLYDNGLQQPSDWTIYYNNIWPNQYLGNYCFTQDLLWPSLQNYPNNTAEISTFFSNAAAGTLPTFSFLEPAWFEEEWGIGQNGNDYHPPANLASGEAFLCQVYNALLQSPQWNNTLFIINFDEHGGTYDHVPPTWNAIPPWENAAEGTTKPDAFECSFTFEQFGVRVPLILVSPYVPESTVFRPESYTPFDHTSVIATILTLLDIPRESWSLGSRVARAPTFENVISLSEPRTGIPLCTTTPTTTDMQEYPPNDLQLMIIHRMLIRALQKSNMDNDTYQKLYDLHFANVKTGKEHLAATKILLDMMAAA